MQDTKHIPNKLIRSESGQALLIVLILLLVGSLIITPLLWYMGTGLKAALVHEERMLEFYAADAGVEDAIWRIQNRQVPPESEQPYHFEFNGKDVAVTIPPQRDTMIQFFETIGALEPHGEGNYNKAAPHGSGSENETWLVVYAPIPSAPGVYDTYQIQVTYRGEGIGKTLNLGCWIHNLYSPDGGPATITEVEPGSITLDNRPKDFSAKTFLGTVFLWEWEPGQGPSFQNNQTRTQTFKISPPVILKEGGRFPPNVSWVAKQRNDIFISWQGDTGFHKIIAVATSPTTSKSTTVESYVFTEKAIPEDPRWLDTMTIVTWKITLNSEPPTPPARG